MYNLQVFVKKDKKYVETYNTTDKTEIYKRLCETLIAKKINCCKWVKSIKRESLYNGYQEITVLQAGGIKEIYTIKN